MNDSPNGGFDGQARAQAIESIVVSRETTNQKMLAMLDRMYNDMMGNTDKQPVNTYAIDAISKMNFACIEPGTAAIVVNAMLGNNPA